jgi:hypothetical protein
MKKMKPQFCKNSRIYDGIYICNLETKPCSHVKMCPLTSKQWDKFYESLKQEGRP